MYKYKRILVIHTAFLGDIILITPLLREIRYLFPLAKIDFLTTPRTHKLVKDNPHIDEIILFDKHHRKLKNFCSVLLILRAKKYDLALSPHSHFTTNFLMFFSGIPNRLGYDRYRSRFLLNIKVTYPTKGHVTEKILYLLSPFTSANLNNETELFLSEKDNTKAELYLCGKKPVVIAPGSVWATKRWKKEYFAELTGLLENSGFRTVFIGSKADRKLADEIIDIAGTQSVNCAGELSITASAALIKGSLLLISNDSAPLHLANAVKTPVYAFFGPTVKTFGYYPYRDEDKVFEVELSCRPCSMHGSSKCPQGHHNCMNFIKPQTVFELIRKNFRAED